MFALPRNVWILTASLSLFMSLSVFVIFLGDIIGQTLAPSDSLSTLPVALLVVGTASGIIPVNKVMSIRLCQYLAGEKHFWAFVFIH